MECLGTASNSSGQQLQGQGAQQARLLQIVFPERKHQHVCDSVRICAHYINTTLQLK